MVGCRIMIKKKKKKKKKKNSDWLSRLLCSKFFGPCVNHPHFCKNEKNVFCIDCNLEICRHCTKAHCLHRRLQIYKYVYHDVVRLHDMHNYLDCSQIQTYKINGEKAVHLNVRPQSKDSKPSTKSKNAASCGACGRYIQDAPNRFCSIACKVSTLSKEESHKIITFPNDISSETYTDEKEWSSEENYTHSWGRQLHKRKGVPRRAPLLLGSSSPTPTVKICHTVGDEDG